MLEVLPRTEYSGKKGAIIEARNGMDKDFLIFARIDASALNGDDEVVARARAMVKMAVDVIVPHQRPPQSKYGIRDKETLRALYKRTGAPKVWIWGMGPPGTSVNDYVEVGAKLCMPDASPSGAVKNTLFSEYQYLYDNGPANPAKLPAAGRFLIKSGDPISGMKWKKNTCHDTTIINFCIFLRQV